MPKVSNITAYDKSGLKIIFALEKLPDCDTVSICMTATNNNMSQMTEFLFQAAVPKVSSLFIHLLIFNCAIHNYSYVVC